MTDLEDVLLAGAMSPKGTRLVWMTLTQVTPRLKARRDTEPVAAAVFVKSSGVPREMCEVNDRVLCAWQGTQLIMVANLSGMERLRTANATLTTLTGKVSNLESTVNNGSNRNSLLRSDINSLSGRTSDLEARTTQTWAGGDVILRRYGRMRELFVNLSFTLPQGNTVLYGSLVPSDDRPPSSNARGGAYFSGGYHGLAYVGTNGEVGVTQRTGGTRSDVQAHVVWTV